MRIGKKPFTTERLNNFAHRQQIVALIEGREAAFPKPFLTLAHDRQVFLCKLSNGKRINLPVSLKSWNDKSIRVQFFVEEDRILAKINLRGSTGAETFLIKENDEIYYTGKLVHQTIGIKRKLSQDGPSCGTAASADHFNTSLKRNKYIAGWWRGKEKELPPPYALITNYRGWIHLCSFSGISILLSTGSSKNAGKEALLSFFETEDAKWVRIESGSGVREYYLVKDGVIYEKPFLRSWEDI